MNLQKKTWTSGLAVGYGFLALPAGQRSNVMALPLLHLRQMTYSCKTLV